MNEYEIGQRQSFTQGFFESDKEFRARKRAASRAGAQKRERLARERRGRAAQRQAQQVSEQEHRAGLQRAVEAAKRAGRVARDCNINLNACKKTIGQLSNLQKHAKREIKLASIKQNRLNNELRTCEKSAEVEAVRTKAAQRSMSTLRDRLSVALRTRVPRSKLKQITQQLQKERKRAIGASRLVTKTRNEATKLRREIRRLTVTVQRLERRRIVMRPRPVPMAPAPVAVVPMQVPQPVTPQSVYQWDDASYGDDYDIQDIGPEPYGYAEDMQERWLTLQ